MSFPTKFKLTIPSAKVELIINAAMKHQEFISLIARPSFWSGRMHVSGTVDGTIVSGYGFVEVFFFLFYFLSFFLFLFTFCSLSFFFHFSISWLTV